MARTTRATTVSKESWRNYANRRQPYIRSVCSRKVIQKAVSSENHRLQEKPERSWRSSRQLPAAEPIFRNPSMKLKIYAEELPTTSAITTTWVTRRLIGNRTVPGAGLPFG